MLVNLEPHFTHINWHASMENSALIRIAGLEVKTDTFVNVLKHLTLITSQIDQVKQHRPRSDCSRMSSVISLNCLFF